MIRKSITVVIVLLVLVYAGLVIMNMGNNLPPEAEDYDPARHDVIAVFGATGTIGDGLLKAAMRDADVRNIHVITRRPSPRIEEGVASGKVTMTIHKDYLDYSAIGELLTEVDAVYWAIGLSAVGMDEETYRKIHVAFPMALVSEWLNVDEAKDKSLHYVSGAGANTESRMMWAREKARAETELAKRAQGTNLRVVAYRPSFVTPTEAEAHLGHKVMNAILTPVGAVVRVEEIGRAMLEVDARGHQIANGTILENKDIVSLAKAYEARQAR